MLEFRGQVGFQPKSVESYDNIAIENKLANRVESPEELVEAIQLSSPVQKDIYTILGVRKDSTQAVTHYVLNELKKVKNPWHRRFFSSFGLILQDSIILT